MIEAFLLTHQSFMQSTLLVKMLQEVYPPGIFCWAYMLMCEREREQRESRIWIFDLKQWIRFVKPPHYNVSEDYERLWKQYKLSTLQKRYEVLSLSHLCKSYSMPLSMYFLKNMLALGIVAIEASRAFCGRPKPERRAHGLHRGGYFGFSK